jgi:hypothetical protein
MIVCGCCYNTIMGDTFCYWDAKSRADLIIIIVNQTVVTVLLSACPH